MKNEIIIALLLGLLPLILILFHAFWKDREFFREINDGWNAKEKIKKEEDLLKLHLKKEGD